MTAKVAKKDPKIKAPGVVIPTAQHFQESGKVHDGRYFRRWRAEAPHDGYDRFRLLPEIEVLAMESLGADELRSPATGVMRT
jgi:hypothetical protein